MSREHPADLAHSVHQRLLNLAVARGEDPNKATQWKAFLKRNRFDEAEPTLSRLIHDLRAFLLEPIHAAATDANLSKTWIAGGPWTNDRSSFEPF